MNRGVSVFLLSLVAAFCEDAHPASAQALPVPQPTASADPNPGRSAPGPPHGFSYSGQLRAYYFVRQNAQQNAANRNRTAFLPGGMLHAEYHFRDSPFSLATSYAFADPFSFDGASPQRNAKIDNTLPGFVLSTFDEAYVKYHTSGLDVTAGDRIFNFLWMPPSDTRLKPASYQGIDLSGKLIPAVTIGVSRIIRYEARTASNFSASTLLTSFPAGASGVTARNTSGALHAYVVAASGPFSSHLEHYSFYNIANLVYADVKLALLGNSVYKPYIAAQYVTEHNTGASVLGRIANDTIGAQVGVSANRELSFTAGLDSSPTHYADVTARSTTAATAGFFSPSGGTATTAIVRPGVYRVAYGGIASPYTDSYTSDPLFTTSISQGMVERRSPGLAFKLASQYLSASRRFKAVVSEAYYQYDNLTGQNRTFEDDVDVQYFFNPVRAGLYKGVSVRQRFANRVQPTVPNDFKYSRTQLEYDF